MRAAMHGLVEAGSLSDVPVCSCAVRGAVRAKICSGMCNMHANAYARSA